MNNDQLRTQVLTILGMLDSSKEEQDAFLYKIESIAQKRMAQIVPEILTDEQLKQAESMRKNGDDTESILNWAESQVPQYSELISAIILDVAEFAAGKHP